MGFTTRQRARAASLAAAGIGLATASAHGQSADTSAEATGPIEEIIISAHPLSAEDLAQASITLDGDDLARALQPSIGDTLGRLPGIHSASFGPAAGRPVIRGLGGPRVRVMEDRIDTMDVSVTSGDHATMVEPFIADSIEIIKGSSTLLYGSGAIGGVVDVHTGRIPHTVPESPIEGRVEVRGADNADGRSSALRLDGGAGNFGWHADAFYRDADEYEIPGFAESERLRALEEAEGGDEEEGEEEAFGFVPGSQYETKGGAVGFSAIGERGFVGMAVSTTDSLYGLPGGHAHEEGEEEEEEEEEGNPILDMQQTRVDLELGASDPLPGFSRLNIRLGLNDYEHEEIEPNGEVATRFENDAYESRIELVHDEVDGWNGVVGLQIAGREFQVGGEEAFVPPVDTLSYGGFWIAERNVDAHSIETGVRFDQVEHEPETGPKNRFLAYGASVGYVYAPLASAWQLGVLADLSARAPVAEELYSFGPHLATQSFEIGDPNLDKEQAFNLSATFNYTTDRLDLYASAYMVRFENYIYLFATGEEEDGLTVRQYAQQNAEFYGLDLSASTTVYEFGADRRLRLNAQFDTVSASLDTSGNDNLPLISPTRYGLGLELQWNSIRASVDFLRVEDQDDVPEFELATDGYN
ncbi:MAG: TonB-dependent receptor, partial [Pseudomonadota bacterium]